MTTLYASQTDPNSTYDLTHSQYSIGKIHEAATFGDAVVRIMDWKRCQIKFGLVYSVDLKSHVVYTKSKVSIMLRTL